MTREDPPLRIRLPEALKAKVQAFAAENRRSMNAEIVSRLERSFGDAPDATTEQRLRALEKDYVSAEEFADFKLLVEATYRRK